MRRHHAVQALVLVAALIGLLGCGEIDDGGDILLVPEPQPFLFPDTPDKLLRNFQTTYETMNFTEFNRMTDPAFFTILKESTYAAFPDVGPTLDAQEEIRIHERMFSMQDVTDPQGRLVNGIQAISFQAFQREGPWSPSAAGDQIPNAEYAVYDVVLVFDRGRNYSALLVQGAIKFYVSHRDTMINGVTRPYYRMRGQLDLTWDQKVGAAGDKGVESNTWGSVKALFR
jgi:hypothetical protein